MVEYPGIEKIFPRSTFSPSAVHGFLGASGGLLSLAKTTVDNACRTVPILTTSGINCPAVVTSETPLTPFQLRANSTTRMMKIGRKALARSSTTVGIIANRASAETHSIPTTLSADDSRSSSPLALPGLSPEVSWLGCGALPAGSTGSSLERMSNSSLSIVFVPLLGTGVLAGSLTWPSER